MAVNADSSTPCAVMFDALKRAAHMNHAQVAGIVLSSKPLSDGRSAVAHATDRSWLSRNVVHAPTDATLDRLFADYGSSAIRLGMRLRSRRARPMTSDEVFDMVAGEAGHAMDAALAAAGGDARPYRNLLERLAANREYSATERAELALVLFVAAGCSGSAARAVSYTIAYEQRAFGAVSPTPASSSLQAGPTEDAGAENALYLGIVRIRNGYVVGQPRWVDPKGPGCVVGSLASGSGDVCDVEKDVSSQHLRIWFEDGAWRARDLGSANGTWLLAAGEDGEKRLEPEAPCAVGPGDELRLGAATRFVLVEGLPG